MTEPPTPLELLLPTGRTSGAVVLGSGAAEALRPRSGGEPADLVVVAPTDEEVSRRGWLDDALARAADVASERGMLYLMLPPSQRRGAIRRLRARGYAPRMAFVHHPGFARSEHLVPAERVSLRQWIGAGERLTPGRRRLASFALALPGVDRVAGTLLPSVGVLAGRRDPAPPFQWLGRLSGTGVMRGLVRAKWRAGRGGAVVVGLDRGGVPVAVAKIALGGEGAPARSAREAEQLERLGPAARRAGVAVPSPTLAELPGGWPVLLLTPMRGVPAASLIGAGRRSPHAVIAGLGEWLARWNQTTLVPGRLESSWAERELLAPAALVADDLPDGPAYLAWLQRRAAAAHGEALPSVAVHRDLTMSNVLLADDALGIVDWEVAGAAGLPLRDFLYAAVDASSARDGYRDRVAAFDRCFPPAGPPRQLAERLDRLRRQAGLTEATASLCVHACWLQHALDERAKRTGGEPRPFLAIVRRLAERAAGGGYPW